MEWKRRTPKGTETRRWASDCKNYVVLWFNAYGQDHYVSMVLCRLEDKKWWSFVQGFPPVKPPARLKRAQKDCEQHKKIFDAVVKLSRESGRKETRFAALREKSPAAFRFIPDWVLKEIDPCLLRLLCPTPDGPDPSDDTEPSESSSPSDTSSPGPVISPTPPTGPAPDATAEVATTKKKTATATKATKTPRGTSAKPAKAPDKAPRKPSKKSTEPSPDSSEPTSPPGKKPKATAKPASPSSRKKKEQH